MRVLVISNLFPPDVIGGYELLCQDLADGLHERGHEVRVLTSHAPVLDDRPYPVRRVFARRAYAAVDLRGAEESRHIESVVSHAANAHALAREIDDFAPDRVLLANLIGLGGLAVLEVLRRRDVPWVWFLGDAAPVPLVDGVSTEILSLYGAESGDAFDRGRYVAMSRNVVDEIERRMGRALRDVRIVPGWIASPAPSRPRAARDGVTRFIVAGAIAEHKGIGLIVDAAVEVAATHPGAFRVELFGGGDPEPFRELLTTAAAREAVTFHGPRERREVLDEFATADVFLFPTHEREPFGVAPLEAASRGCVPIMTATAGVAERFVDGVHAIKIARDTDALAEAMRGVLDGRYDLDRMSEAARELVADDLTLGLLLDEFEAALLEPGPESVAADAPTELAEVLHSISELEDRAYAAWNRQRDDDMLPEPSPQPARAPGLVQRARSKARRLLSRGPDSRVDRADARIAELEAAVSELRAELRAVTQLLEQTRGRVIDREALNARLASLESRSG